MYSMFMFDLLHYENYHLFENDFKLLIFSTKVQTTLFPAIYAEDGKSSQIKMSDKKSDDPKKLDKMKDIKSFFGIEMNI